MQILANKTYRMICSLWLVERDGKFCLADGYDEPKNIMETMDTLAEGQKRFKAMHQANLRLLRRSFPL